MTYSVLKVPLNPNQPTPTDRVAWSVGLLVCHTSEPCKNGCTNRDAVWVVGSDGP